MMRRESAAAAAAPTRVRARGRVLRRLALLAAGIGIAGAAAALYVLDERGIAPRTLAPYIAQRSAGHNPVITGTGKLAASTLERLDRGSAMPGPLPAFAVGARPEPARSAPAGVQRLATSIEEIQSAMAQVQPGETITLAPGTYRIRGRGLQARQAGSELQPIVLRADQPGTVVLDVDATVGITVAAPYWRVENLTLRGVCARQHQCEHAFHIVGAAHHFSALNNTVLDFNSHFKINGLKDRFPDDGVIEGNTLSNQDIRQTRNPVTPIDVVAASGWVIRGNLISDFVKGEGDRISYGAFAKGAGSGTRFEGNVVVCEARLRGAPGQRVGLSLGGGGTGPAYCRDRRCITEQERGSIQGNLVASCSDAGIYLNSAAGSVLAHNTLVDTTGIDVRFPASTAQVEGNLVDGAIRSRNDAVLRLVDNLYTPLAYSYAGYHPQRGLFRSAASFDFTWRDAPPRRILATGVADLCGAARPAAPRYGAFEDFTPCLAR